MLKEKFNYESPLVEVIEAEVEKGFAQSGGTESVDPLDWLENSNPGWLPF